MTDSTPRSRKTASARRLYRDAALREGRGFTPDKQAEYLSHLCDGIPRGAAAKLVEVGYKTVCDFRKKDPAFAAAEVEAEAVATEPAEVKLREMALDGHMVALMFYLQNRAPDRWKDMRRVEKKVEHSGVVQLEAGQVMRNIAELEARLAERSALRGLPAASDATVIDVEVLPPNDDEPGTP